MVEIKEEFLILWRSLSTKTQTNLKFQKMITEILLTTDRTIFLIKKELNNENSK